MRFKILTFDGRPVKMVTQFSIVYNDVDDVTLWPPETTLKHVEDKTTFKEPWKSKRAALVRKCELEEVELRYIKSI